MRFGRDRGTYADYGAMAGAVQGSVLLPRTTSTEYVRMYFVQPVRVQLATWNASTMHPAHPSSIPSRSGLPTRTRLAVTLFAIMRTSVCF